MEEECGRSLLDRINSFTDKNVLVIGDAIIDEHVYGSVSGVSLETPTLKMNVDKTVRSAGGAGNVVKNLVGLGSRVSFATVVGDDGATDFFKSWSYNASGLDLAIVTEKDRVSPVKRKNWADGYGVLEQEWLPMGEISNESHRELCNKIDKRLDENTYDAIIVQDMGHGVVSYDLMDQLISSIVGVRLFANAQISNGVSQHDKFRGVSLVSMSEKEASIVANQYGVCSSEANDLSRFLGPDVCVSLGSRGANLFLGDSLYYSLASSVVPVDTCGAGDSFLSALVLADPYDSPRDALRVANLWAGLSVEKKGTQVPNVEFLKGVARSSNG